MITKKSIKRNSIHPVHDFKNKTFSKLEMEGNLLNLIRNTSKKPKANIIFNGETNTKHFLRSETKNLNTTLC